MNEYSEKFQMIKDFYDKGLWGKKAVKNAVNRGWITEEEYKEITNEEY